MKKKELNGMEETIKRNRTALGMDSNLRGLIDSFVMVNENVSLDVILQTAEVINPGYILADGLIVGYEKSLEQKGI